MINFSKEKIVDGIIKWLYFFLGSALYAVAFQLFYIQNGIAAGGFTGIAMALATFIPLQVGVISFCLNVPFIIWAGIIYDKQYAFKSFMAAFSFTFFLNILEIFPPATTNLVLAAMFGGVVYAVASIFILKAESSGGGTELLAKIIWKYFPQIKIGSIYLVVDGFAVVFATIVFKSVELGLVAILAVYVCSVFTNRMIAGVETASLCYIITKSEPEILAQEINRKLKRGATLQKGIGMYNKEEKNIMIVVIKPRQIIKLRTIVKSLDESAFVVVLQANEVRGAGFSNIVS